MKEERKKKKVQRHQNYIIIMIQLESILEYKKGHMYLLPAIGNSLLFESLGPPFVFGIHHGFHSSRGEVILEVLGQPGLGEEGERVRGGQSDQEEGGEKDRGGYFGHCL